MYLLDTNVISEFRKIKLRRADPHVVAWSQGVSPDILYLSTINVFEIDYGVRQLLRKDTVASEALRRWLEEVILPNFHSRILPFGIDEARICAGLWAQKSRSYRDSMIAATATKYGLTVVTRNVIDFQDMGVAIINPWEHQP